MGGVELGTPPASHRAALTPLFSASTPGTQRDKSASKPSQQPITAEPWYGGGGCQQPPEGGGDRLWLPGDEDTPPSPRKLGWRVSAQVTTPSWQGIILVYDITDEKSFENIQNWMKSIKEVGVHWGWGHGRGAGGG